MFSKSLWVIWLMLSIPSQAANHTVNILASGFFPNELQIRAGDGVFWTNNDFSSHTITSTSNAWPRAILFGSQNQWGYTFSNPGVYAYVCDFAGFSGLISVLPANSKPSVVVRSPVNGATFSAPASFTIQADAGDFDGGISEVAFYLDGALHHRTFTYPYIATVQSLGAGSHAVSAVAIDIEGASSTNSVAITVTSSGILDTNLPALQWATKFGGSGYEKMKAAAPTAGGGFLLAGNSPSGASGSKSSTNFGSEDYWIVRVGPYGNKIWDRSYGGTDGDELNCLLPTSDGGFLLGGASSSGISGNKSSPSYGETDGWLVKIDENGNKLWEACYGGSGRDGIQRIVPLVTGGYLCALFSESTNSGNKVSTNYGSFDCWLIKIDASGGKIWERNFGGTDVDYPRDVCVTVDGGIVVAGVSGSPVSGNKTSTNFGAFDYWALRIDDSGNKLWEQTFGGDKYDQLYCMIASFDGGVVLGGGSESGISGNKTSPNYGIAFEDYWTVKIDAGGYKQWEAAFGGTGEDIQRAMLAVDDGGILLAGQSSSNVSGNKTSPRLSSQSYDDFWLLKIGPTGAKVWESVFGVTQPDFGTCLTIGSDLGVLMAGQAITGSVFGSNWDYSALKLSPRQPVILTETITQTNNEFSFMIMGKPRQEIVVEISSNLVHWADAATNLLSVTVGTNYFTHPVSNRAKFFRARTN